MRAVLLVTLLLGTAHLPAQQAPTVELPPSEELKASIAPFNAARAQPDDMTQADLLALGVGVRRASYVCLRLEPSQEELAKQPEELFAFARLCIFGQQFEPARQAVVRYLELPVPPQREMALLLLVQVFLGLKDAGNAAVQVLSLERDYPYDTQIHFAADQTILEGALRGDELNSTMLGLCADQLKNTLPLLENGKALPGKDASATADTLFSDAVRCVDIARSLHDGLAQSTLPRLERIVQLPAWQPTAELATMRSALARTEMVGLPTPSQVISGKLVRATGPLLSRTVTLAHGTALLVPFTLWSPSVVSIVHDLHITAPHQAIYLLTSWAANTGGADEESKELLIQLRAIAQSLPTRVSVLMVPDTVFKEFHADAFPAAIVVRDGLVGANLPLVGDAAKRMTILSLGPIAPEVASQHRSK